MGNVLSAWVLNTPIRRNGKIGIFDNDTRYKDTTMHVGKYKFLSRHKVQKV